MTGDASADRLAEAFKRPEYADWVELLAMPINGGFGWANDQGILSLTRKPNPPDYIHLLNPDTEVMQGAVELLVGGSPDAVPERYRALITLAAGTGLRQGEALESAVHFLFRPFEASSRAAPELEHWTAC